MAHRVVWILRHGVPEVQVWRTDNVPEPKFGVAMVAKYEIKPEEERLPIYELAKRYPCPVNPAQLKKKEEKDDK